MKKSIVYFLFLFALISKIYAQDILVPTPIFSWTNPNDAFITRWIDTSRSIFLKGWNWGQTGKEVMSYEL